jgi:hypothetical protein
MYDSLYQYEEMFDINILLVFRYALPVFRDL